MGQTIERYVVDFTWIDTISGYFQETTNQIVLNTFTRFPANNLTNGILTTKISRSLFDLSNPTLLGLLMIITGVFVIAFFLYHFFTKKPKYYKTILNDSPIASMIFQGLRLKFVNNALCELTGYSSEELLSMDINKLIHPKSLREINKTKNFTHKYHNNFRSEFIIITKSQKHKWIDFSTKNISHRGKDAILATASDITEKKSYEKQLIETEERYALIVMASNDGISDYDILKNEMYFSPQLKNLLGYKEHEIKGSLHNWIESIHENDKEAVIAVFHNIKNANKSFFQLEYRIVCKDKQVKWVSAVFNLVFDTHNTPIRILGTHSDITQKKNTEKRLKDSELLYKSLFHRNSAIMLVINSKTLKIEDANEAAASYFGYQPETMKGISTNHIYLANGLEKKSPQSTSENASTSNYIHKKIKLSNGTIRDIELYNSNIEINGKCLEYHIIFDITERIQMEKDIKEAKETAEHANKAKSFFISNVSHEIRTPLNAIVGLSELFINDKTLNPEQFENMKSIKYSSDHLLGIINDVLDFSKLEAGKVSFELTDFDVEKLLGSCMAAFSFKTKEKGLNLKLSIAENVPKLLKGDPSRLRQVVLNLLSNAIKFTPEGEIEIKLKILSKTNKNALLRFSVSDSGIGIPENKLSEIFESFAQAENDTTRKYGGTGLGLSISKKLIEQQKGKIGVNSIAGIGSTFWFELPYEVSNKEVITNDDITEAGTHTLRNIRILMAEDDKMNQYVMSQIMKKHHAKLEICENGLKAIHKLEENDYDLVLMDLHMPELNGYEATKIIRNPDSKVRDHQIPIIALTADVSLETRNKVKEVGMDGFVTKPSEQKVLLQKITQTLIKKNRLPVSFTKQRLHVIKEKEKNFVESQQRVKKALGDIFDDDYGNTIDLVNKFLTDIPQIIDEIKMATNAKDIKKVNTLIHKIKPGYSYMGFKEVSEKISQIQRLIKDTEMNWSALDSLCHEIFRDSYEIMKILKQLKKEYYTKLELSSKQNKT